MQVKTLLDDILEKLTDEFNIPELMAKVEERTPYIVVAFQECERMNLLTSEIKRSLRELDLGLKVEYLFKNCIMMMICLIPFMRWNNWGWQSTYSKDTSCDRRYAKQNSKIHCNILCRCKGMVH